MTKYKIGMNDLERPGGIERLYKDGFTKQDVMKVVHGETDCREFGHKTRTDQRNLVDALFDRTKNQG
jgi:hypothetical protein